MAEWAVQWALKMVRWLGVLVFLFLLWLLVEKKVLVEKKLRVEVVLAKPAVVPEMVMVVLVVLLPPEYCWEGLPS